MLQFIPRHKCTHIKYLVLVQTIQHTIQKHTFSSFTSLKLLQNYKCKQILTILWIMWMSTQSHYAWRDIHCRSPVVTLASCQAQRGLWSLSTDYLHTALAGSYVCDPAPHSQVCSVASYCYSVAPAQKFQYVKMVPAAWWVDHATLLSMSISQLMPGEDYKPFLLPSPASLLLPEMK